MQKGAIGVNLGRNVWQNPNPVATMRALNGIIHDKLTPKQANDLFLSLKNS
jgi:putative autoinducer-2 (AI-2) aldolase